MSKEKANTNQNLFVRSYATYDFSITCLNDMIDVFHASQHPELMKVENITEKALQETPVAEIPKWEIVMETESRWRGETTIAEMEQIPPHLELIFDTNFIINKDVSFDKICKDLENSANIKIAQEMQDIVNLERQGRGWEALMRFYRIIDARFSHGSPGHEIFLTAKDFLHDFMEVCNSLDTKSINTLKKELTTKWVLSESYTLKGIDDMFFQKILEGKNGKKSIMIDRAQVLYSTLFNIYKKGYAPKTLRMNISYDMDTQILARIFIYEIIPRYFAKRTLEKLMTEMKRKELKRFLNANKIANREEYTAKTIVAAREYVCELYKAYMDDPDITKTEIAYILWKESVNTIEIITPLMNFLNDLEGYIEGKTEYIKEKIISDGKEKNLHPLEIIKQMEERNLPR